MPQTTPRFTRDITGKILLIFARHDQLLKASRGNKPPHHPFVERLKVGLDRTNAGDFFKKNVSIDPAEPSRLNLPLSVTGRHWRLWLGSEERLLNRDKLFAFLTPRGLRAERDNSMSTTATNMLKEHDDKMTPDVYGPGGSAATTDNLARVVKLLSGCFDVTGAVRLERSAPGLGVLGNALARQVEIVHDAAGAEIWGAPVEPALLASIAYTCGFDRGTPGDEKVDAVALDDWEHGWQSPLRQAVWDSFAGQKVKANGEVVHGAPLAEFGAALDAWIPADDFSASQVVRKGSAGSGKSMVAPQEDDWWVEKLEANGIDIGLPLTLKRIGATNELAVNFEATFLQGNRQWQTRRIELQLRRARGTPPSILVPLGDTLRPGVKVEVAPGKTLTLECKEPEEGLFHIETQASALPPGWLFQGSGQRIVKINPEACQVITGKVRVRRRDLRQEGEPVNDDLVVRLLESLQLAATLNGNRAAPGEAVQEIAIITVAERTFGIVKKEKA